MQRGILKTRKSLTRAQYDEIWAIWAEGGQDAIKRVNRKYRLTFEPLELDDDETNILDDRGVCE
jgi:hypothetical protein